MDIFEEEKDVPYSVAWIDCQVGGDQLGRSLFMGGDFASKELPKKLSKNPYVCSKSIKLTVPFNFPKFALNSATIKAFNSIYYNMNFTKKKEHVVTYDKFFYPLDSIHNWNRIYGKPGFLQYQFVLPIEASRKGMSEILNRIINIGTGSFLAVLKLFGEQPKHYGNISFPQNGYTLALDFPINKNLFSKLNDLDTVVVDYGGKLYLTKDSRTTSKSFFKSYSALLPSFLETKHKWDKKLIFSSLQSKRLNLGS
jgi:hypothetical protein